MLRSCYNIPSGASRLEICPRPYKLFQNQRRVFFWCFSRSDKKETCPPNKIHLFFFRTFNEGLSRPLRSSYYYLQFPYDSARHFDFERAFRYFKSSYS